MKLDARELGAVLAGLRAIQTMQTMFNRGLPPPLLDIMNDGGSFEPLTSEEIDTLCDRLNSGED